MARLAMRTWFLAVRRQRRLGRKAITQTLIVMAGNNDCGGTRLASHLFFEPFFDDTDRIQNTIVDVLPKHLVDLDQKPERHDVSRKQTKRRHATGCCLHTCG